MQSFLAKLEIAFREFCFSHGQVYVALFRATHRSTIVTPTKCEDWKTKKIVCPDHLCTNSLYLLGIWSWNVTLLCTEDLGRFL